MDKIDQIERELAHFAYGRDMAPEVCSLDESIEKYAERICQLFKPKADESRLLTLTEKEMVDRELKMLGNREKRLIFVWDWEYALLEAQDAKTTRIKDAECQRMLSVKDEGINDG